MSKKTVIHIIIMRIFVREINTIHFRRTIIYEQSIYTESVRYHHV